ncbi:MAG: hypothetical protein U0414_19965 [Polyangiaceae bacterium]
MIRRLARFSLALVSLSAVAGCGVSAAVKAARDHDIPALAKALEAEAKSGKLDDGEVEDVARALAKSEIREAKGDPGVVVIESMGECADSVEGALDARSEKDDDVAAAAGAMLLSHKLVSADEYADLAIEKDQRPMFRALGVIGGPRVVQVLRDLWNTADSGGRRAIAIAWASPKTFDAGGKEELLWAAQHAEGDGGIYASIALARASGAGSEEQGAALGVLTRAIKLGTRSERVSAISMSPSSNEVLDAIRFAKDDSDVGISLVAWSRLHTEGTSDEVKTSIDKLFDIAKGEHPEAPRAQEELAWFGEARVKPLLEKQLKSDNGYARVVGGRGLIALGEFVKAAPNLGDASTDVRVQTACAILGKRDR